MSQLQQAFAPAVQGQINDLIEEIAFQRVLLESMDDTVVNRQQAELDVRNEIRDLENQVKRLRRGTTADAPTASNSSDTNSSQAFEAPIRQSPPKGKPARPPSTPEALMDASQGPDEWHSLASSTASTPNSAEPMANLVSPSQMTLPSRKRSHSTHLDGALAPYEDNKSRRTSPSPYMNGPTTPSTASSGDEDFANFERDFRERQKTEEQRREQERADAEIARIMQESLESGLMNPPANTTPSAFDRISGTRALPSGSASSKPYIAQANSEPTYPGRTLPWSQQTNNNSSAKVEPKGYGTHSRVKQEQGSSSHTVYNSFGQSNGVKAERSPSRTMPGAFQEDSDSDIEIIPASMFYHNRSVPKTEPKTEPWSPSSPVSNVDYETKDSLRRAMFGISPLPHDWMNPPGAFSQYGLGEPSDYGMNEPAASHSLNQHNPLADIFAQPHGFNYLDLPDYLDNDTMPDYLDHTMNDPRKTNEDIKALLDNIKPDLDVAPEAREETPEGMRYPLYEHQKIALTWLKAMEEGSNKGGILADDMGLGKTISSLALLLSRPSPDRARKTTLIVGPVALVRQWEQEIRKKIKPGYRLATYLMHGQPKKLSWPELQNFDVVMTTYGTLAHEYKKMSEYIEKQKAENRGEYDQAPMAKKFPLLGPKTHFWRVILDEAQSIKNKNTGAARAAYALKSVHRLCLTGTPMMNNVGELFSLIHFLRIRPYNEWTRFSQDFGCLTRYDKRNRDVEGSMQKLQAVIKAILLRRTKKSLIDGKPIISLPPKTEEIQHVIFTEDEQAYYKALESRTQLQFNRYVKAGTVGKNYSNILVLLLRLRQACCHPHLIMDYDEAPPAGANIDADVMVKLAQSLTPEVVSRLLEIEAFECPVCYDVATNPQIIVPCGHDTCSECLSRISDQAAQQHAAEGNDGRASCKCPTCRGDLKMDRIIDYLTFKKVHMPGVDAPPDEKVVSDAESETDDSETESEIANDDDVDNKGDLRGFIVPDDENMETQDDNQIEDGDDEDDFVPRSKDKAKSKKEKHRRNKGKGKEKQKTVQVSLAMLKKEASKSLEHRRRYMRYLRKNWEPSAKIDKCMELLEQFQNDGQKTIVFSQFVTLLDLVQVAIDQKKWKCLRYDGGMSADQRNSNIIAFTDKADQNVMLISLKAGNAGLNLVAASRVIILDPFWNPFIEMQAVDRAYRIGQQREVQVHRILIAGTVEDRIIELQEKKRKLVESALDEGPDKGVGRLDVAQLKFLFGV